MYSALLYPNTDLSPNLKKRQAVKKLISIFSIIFLTSMGYSADSDKTLVSWLILKDIDAQSGSLISIQK